MDQRATTLGPPVHPDNWHTGPPTTLGPPVDPDNYDDTWYREWKETPEVKEAEGEFEKDIQKTINDYGSLHAAHAAEKAYWDAKAAKRKHRPPRTLTPEEVQQKEKKRSELEGLRQRLL